MKPPNYVVIYGLAGQVGGAVLLRYPASITDKAIMPHLKAVARLHGGDVGGKNSANEAYIECGDEEVWANKKFLSYDWDGEKFRPVEKGGVSSKP